MNGREGGGASQYVVQPAVASSQYVVQPGVHVASRYFIFYPPARAVHG